MTAITASERQALQQSAQQWLQSPAGQATLQKAVQEVRSITARLQEERRVDVKILHEPFTV